MFRWVIILIVSAAVGRGFLALGDLIEAPQEVSAVTAIFFFGFSIYYLATDWRIEEIKPKD